MRHLKLKGVVAALAVAGFASLTQAGPVTDRDLAKDAGRMVARQWQLGGNAL
jgi:hypothetical protein